jgi:hypothetical protein
MKGVCLKPMVINGNLSVERVIYAELENITIQCDPGYTIVGSPNIICSNRTWYPEVPSCQMVSGTTQETSVISPFVTVAFPQSMMLSPDSCKGAQLARFTLITMKHHGELEGVDFSALWLDPERES